MDALSYLRNIHLDKYIQDTHQAITQKFPVDNTEFDAWYTNRDHVSQGLLQMGREIAQEVREDCRFVWKKSLPQEFVEPLRREGTLPEHWEDAPDGTLFGIAILAAGWVANQAAAKSRDNPKDIARQLSDRCLRPLILASMDLGIETAERNGYLTLLPQSNLGRCQCFRKSRKK